MTRLWRYALLVAAASTALALAGCGGGGDDGDDDGGMGATTLPTMVVNPLGMGGQTMMLLAGAGLTTSLGFAWTTVEVDRRIKAAVGYVPYFGQVFLPAFGRDQHGLDAVTMPFLAIAGTPDTTAPLSETQQGVMRLAGTRELVALSGVRQGFDERRPTTSTRGR